MYVCMYESVIQRQLNIFRTIHNPHQPFLELTNVNAKEEAPTTVHIRPNSLSSHTRVLCCCRATTAHARGGCTTRTHKLARSDVAEHTSSPHLRIIGINPSRLRRSRDESASVRHRNPRPRRQTHRPCRQAHRLCCHLPTLHRERRASARAGGWV